LASVAPFVIFGPWGLFALSPYHLLIYAILVILVRTMYILLLTLEGHRLSPCCWCSSSRLSAQKT